VRGKNAVLIYRGRWPG